MEKSNELSEETPSVISNEDLNRIGRRLDVSKAFFVWVSALYFLSSLFAIGGLWPDIFEPIAKGMIGVLVFGTGALLYSLYAYGAAISGGIWHTVRFGVLFLIIGAFTGALLRNFGIV